MAEARLFHAALPMQVGFAHRAARRRRSDSLILRISLDGVSGIGECAPRAYVTGETSDGVTEALQCVPMRTIFDRLRNTEDQELLALLREDGFEKTFGIVGGNNLVCLLETAVLDLLGHRLQLGVREMLPTGPQDSASRGEPLPVSQVIDLGITADDFLDSRGPFHFVKIKASGAIERDARTVTAIRENLCPSIPVMVDANMSWTYDAALANMKVLRDRGADLVEEPLRKGAWAELRELRRNTGVAIMLDESLCTLDDARIAVEAKACDAFNIRVAKCGGLINSARTIDYARQNGIEFQIGVQVAEVGPLINAGRALAFRHRDAITVEAGQSDRFFSHMIVSPPPVVDRTTNTICPIEDAGVGLILNNSANPYAVLEFTEDKGQWQPLTASLEAEV